MAATSRRPPLDKNRKKEGADGSIPEKNKMGHEIEQIFRDRKRKGKDSPGVVGQISTKPKVGTRKKDKMVDAKTALKDEKAEKKKKKIYPVDESSQSRSKRRKTADGLAIYSAEELGVGNPDAGNTPLCPFDCSCCF